MEKIEIIEIRKENLKEQEILKNLIKMYCYEWSQYNLFDVDENGVFPFEKYLELYFERPNRFNYLVLVNGKLAGFALIDDDFPINNSSNYSIGEFFVMHKYRKMGVGTKLATYLFDKYRGKWQIGFHPHNIGSVKFWTKVINEYTNGNYEKYENVEGLKYNDGSLGMVIMFSNNN